MPWHEHRHRLAFDLEVAVRHGDRRLLVAAGDELRRRVAAVVDERLVDAAEARAGVGRDVLEVERLEDVDHEVAARPIGRQRLDAPPDRLRAARRARWPEPARRAGGRRASRLRAASHRAPRLLPPQSSGSLDDQRINFVGIVSSPGWLPSLVASLPPPRPRGARVCTRSL